ncbi:MAG: DUF2170 family protein [Gammaproteobacteria bacterium]|nr:DUF2170 family protein [Gammaproteobacteria bacterium]
MNSKLEEIVSALNSATTANGLAITAKVIDQQEEMIEVLVEEREEFPIIIDIDESQIIAVTNLWRSNEIKEGAEAEMMSAMLAMNLPMPLSAFCRTGDHYQLFGAMSIHTLTANIVDEVGVLSDNTLEVFDALREFLN